MDKHKKNGTKILVLDAPTLIENDLHKEVDYVILVWVDQNTQIQRVRARDGISREDAINRINSQMPLERKRILLISLLKIMMYCLKLRNRLIYLLSF